MSRSYKKSKIHGYSTATSEKEDKQIMNRTLRSRHKQQIQVAMVEDNWDEFLLDTKDDAMNQYDMAKDGKGYWEDADDEFFRK